MNVDVLVQPSIDWAAQSLGGACAPRPVPMMSSSSILAAGRHTFRPSPWMTFPAIAAKGGENGPQRSSSSRPRRSLPSRCIIRRPSARSGERSLASAAWSAKKSEMPGEVLRWICGEMWTNCVVIPAKTPACRRSKLSHRKTGHRHGRYSSAPPSRPSRPLLCALSWRRAYFGM